MLTETLLNIPFSLIGQCSVALTFHWLQGKCARIDLSKAAYFDFTESQAASCMHFQCVNRRLKVYEACFWKDFQNK